MTESGLELSDDPDELKRQVRELSFYAAVDARVAEKLGSREAAEQKLAALRAAAASVGRSSTAAADPQ